MEVKANSPLYEDGRNIAKGETFDADEKRVKALGEAVTVLNKAPGPVTLDEKPENRAEKTRAKK
jgi:hypothetical protein